MWNKYTLYYPIKIYYTLVLEYNERNKADHEKWEKLYMMSQISYVYLIKYLIVNNMKCSYLNYTNVLHDFFLFAIVKQIKTA